MTSRFIKLLPVAAALALGGVASAGTVRELPSVVVKYGDLDLNTTDGIASLHARLQRAARDVCAELDSRVLGLREQYKQCVTDAVVSSVAKVDNPRLTTFHRYGRKASAVASNG
ncbi:MAG TPA: UrcA family protein [Steroidobacteraceae bacterium]